MASARIAAVTGANKGVGLEIARYISNTEDWRVIVAARDQSRGTAAVDTLKSEGGDAKFVPLDVTDPASRKAFKQSIESEHGGKLDALVNNAGFAYKGADPTPFKDQAEPTFAINFFSTVALTEELLPLVKKSDDGRIVFVASQSGLLKIIKDEKLKAKFASAGEPNGLDYDELMQLAHKFVDSVKAGTHKQAGFPDACYGMSKLCLIAYTKILAKKEPSLRINCCCPGYCATDMTGGGGRSPAEGAKTPYKLACKLTKDDPTGGFWYNEEQIAWDGKSFI